MLPEADGGSLHLQARACPTVLVLSVSAGAGHVRAAQALCAGAVCLPVQTLHLDVMDFVPSRFRKLYTDVYIRMVGKYPHAWGYLYRGMNRARPDDRSQRLRRWFEQWQARALLARIDELRPDAIVCTHFMPAELLAHGRATGSSTCPVWVQVTDFDLHRIWIQPGVTGYFVGSEEVAYRMRAEGVAAAAIHVQGLPIMPAFGRPCSRVDNARRLGLNPHCKTVLLMGGGFGLGNFEQIARRLLALDPTLQVIALAGRNIALMGQLAPLVARYPDRFVVQGQTDEVERFMACADLVVTKSGGLTCAECLAIGLPMIVNAPIPGQEERNADFLVEQGVAMKAIDDITVEYRVSHLLAHPKVLAAMAARAREIALPGAAAQAMRIVLAHLQW